MQQLVISSWHVLVVITATSRRLDVKNDTAQNRLYKGSKYFIQASANIDMQETEFIKTVRYMYG